MVRSNDSTGNLTFCDLWPSKFGDLDPEFSIKIGDPDPENGLVAKIAQEITKR